MSAAVAQKWPSYFRARLRDGNEADVRLSDQPAGVFILLGHHLKEHWPHLWRSDGRWRENGTTHHLDIVEILAVHKP